MPSLLPVLLRAFVPSWRFFDRAVSAPLLECRAWEGGTPGEWGRAIAPVPRRGWHLLFNPRGNLALAQHAVAERLLDEAGTDPVTVGLAYAIAGSARPAGCPVPPDLALELRLRDPATGEVLLVLPPRPLPPA